MAIGTIDVAREGYMIAKFFCKSLEGERKYMQILKAFEGQELFRIFRMKIKS